MTIAAAYIVKDAAETFEASIASVRPHVAEVNVYLDGPQADGTDLLLHRLAAEDGPPIRVERGEFCLRNLAAARERSCAMASDGIEWLLWLDADDEVRGGERLHTAIETIAAADADYGMVIYDYCDEGWGGREDWVFWRERIIRRAAGWRWCGYIHEFCRFDRERPRPTIDPECLYVWHMRRVMRPPNYYLDWINYATSQGDDPRAWLLLASVLVNQGKPGWPHALRRYLAESDPDDEDERSYRYLALSALDREAAIDYVMEWQAAWMRGEAEDPFADTRLEKLATTLMRRVRAIEGAGKAPELFEQLLRDLPPRLGIHGVKHWRRVWENGLEIANSNGADVLVVAAFAALHDSCRLNDGRDPEHGDRAANRARQLHDEGRLPLDAGQLETLCGALADHDRGLVSDDQTIGSCWDADRLDLVRRAAPERQDVVQLHLLSTDAGRRLARQRLIAA